MLMLALIDCAQLLTVDPKTVTYWARQAEMTLHPHPMDARSKCLTLEQVQQLATLHRCILPLDVLTSVHLIEMQKSEEQTLPESVIQTSFSLQEEASLRERLANLEMKMVTLQEQVGQLALLLLQEQTQREPQYQQLLESLLTALGQRSLLGKEHHLHPAEQRARGREIPQIIYNEDSHVYFIIRPGEGNFSIKPDTPEWFDWLATLSSFRFVGREGRFTASRIQANKKFTRSWTAQRTVDKKNVRKHLGLTERLTLDHLEKAAASITSHLKKLDEM